MGQFYGLWRAIPSQISGTDCEEKLATKDAAAHKTETEIR